MSEEIFVVLGLGNGDEGKGKITDFLVRTRGIKNVVRFNGGSQAAHNVVTCEGVHHCFAQFGSGLFVPGTRSILSRYMLVDPMSFMVEYAALKAKGVGDALERTMIDGDCAIITPFNSIINRMREIARGANRHGSCGMGIGETAYDRMVHGDRVLLARDFFSPSVLRAKLSVFWFLKRDIAEQLLEMNPENEDLRFYHDKLSRINIEELMREYDEFSRRVKIVEEDAILETIAGEGAVFEGAQGVWLDRDIGPKPYVTYSKTTFENADELIRKSGFRGEIEKIGLLRAYATRHGAGPFVTENAELDSAICPCHNTTGEWQGKFRIGWFDVVAAKAAIASASGLSSIAITNLDRLDTLSEIRVVTNYEFIGKDFQSVGSVANLRNANGKRFVDTIKLSSENAPRLAEVLSSCCPGVEKSFTGWQKELSEICHYDDLPSEARDYISYLTSADALNVPISFISVGANANQTIKIQ